MTGGVLIKYGDIAIGAREQFEINASDKEDFVDLSQLKQDIVFPNYVNPCELYSTVLDGGALPFPSNPHGASLGWWSEQISNNDGTFSTPIVLLLTATDYFYSQGITLHFDNINEIYAKELNIKWYKDGELISDKNFYPDSAVYFCANAVEFYNKIEITFYSLNMPQNRLKLHSIVYGLGAEFTRDNLQSVKIIQEIDAVSAQIPINTCDFDLQISDDVSYSFAERQPIEIYFNGVFRAKSFIKSFNRKSKTQWSVKTEDYIGIMQNIMFSGGVYENTLATDILSDIFNTAKVPFTIAIDGSLLDKVVSGHIGYTTCRDALMQVAFAIGAVADTSGREDVYVYELSDDITQIVPLNRIIQGQSSSNEARVTAFELTSHEFIETDEISELYKSGDDGAGSGIMIRFSEPIQPLSLSITGDGEILDRGANFAIINAGKNCVLSGKKYAHIKTVKTKKNPLVLSSDTENIISIENATLVSNNNVDNLLEKCYNYYVNTKQTNSKIVEGKHAVDIGKTRSVEYDKTVNVGERIGVQTEYLGTVYGRVIKQTYNLNGGIIIKDSVVR